jgi:hypothetical protein
MSNLKEKVENVELLVWTIDDTRNSTFIGKVLNENITKNILNIIGGKVSGKKGEMILR